MPRLKFFTKMLSALALAASAGPVFAQSASANGSASIVEPSGVVILQDVLTSSRTIVQNVLTNVNASLVILGTSGDSVSVSVPSSVSLSSAAGDNLTVGTISQLSTNSLVLSDDTVSVNIGAIANGETAAAPPGTYGGVLVVLAQYN
ncbi:MAG: DUF4402 domain-containing protein [Sphingosinicella sp.]|nr:DUF4402 domain-containing protein [Sphingosinicella sp.]